MNDKRKQIQDLVNKVLLALDPTGINSKKYEAMFAKMSDQQFAKWMDAFIADDKSNIRLDIEEFGNDKRRIRFDNVEKAANILGIKLFEYVYMPHLSSDPNHPVRTRYPVLVGWLNIKRTQQLVTKKTGLAINDENRDEMTGAVKGDAKGGTTTGIENELLAGVGAKEVLAEISGARGDNVMEYESMLKSIAEKGSVKLADVKTNAFDKPTLLAADMYFAAMGLKTDLISPSYYSYANIKSIMDNE